VPEDPDEVFCGGFEYKIKKSGELKNLECSLLLQD